MSFDGPRKPLALELIMRANKQLTLGSFEYDLDRSQIVFRITNVFEKEVFDADIISSMVHCTIAELDRIVPLAGVINRTNDDLLEDISLPSFWSVKTYYLPSPNSTEKRKSSEISAYLGKCRLDLMNFRS